MRELKFIIPEEFDGVPSQIFLKAQGFSRRTLIRLKQTGGLTRGGEILRTVDAVHSGEELLVRLCDDSESAERNPSLNAPIIYEDEDVAVFDKPPYMPIHPSIRHRADTLANLFAALYTGIPFRPINRLDRNTSGLCVCAKNQYAASVLCRSLTKAYFAVTCGTPPVGAVDAPIGRAADSIITRCVTPEGQRAVTHFERVGGSDTHPLLRVTLETGRTHQIRVHMAYIGYPLCGDEMYGGDMSEIRRHALHCGEVSFTRPLTNEIITLTSPLPTDMSELIKGDTE